MGWALASPLPPVKRSPAAGAKAWQAEAVTPTRSTKLQQFAAGLQRTRAVGSLREAH